MTPPANHPHPRGLLLTFALAFTVAAAIPGVLAWRTGLAVFVALAALSAWAAVVATIALLPRAPFRLREVFSVLGFIAVVAVPAWWLHSPRMTTAGATDALLQLAAVALAILAFALHFLATFGQHVGRETPAPALAAIVPFSRLLAFAHALTVAALLARLYLQRNALHGVAVALACTLAVLLVETLLHRVARLYQPVRLRSSDAVFGGSVLLPALFGENGPLRSLAATTQKTFGVQLADTWLVQLTRILVAPLLLLGLAGLWLSSAVTRVPVESRGVLVQRGAFARESLAPGLHFHAPWPWARVITVPTERVQEISLGFERDLSGPVLWSEKHFEGEQNLLVGEGEELLTINVPVHYRIRDAVAFLERAGDARAALEALGYRELLELTTTHSAFGFMTDDRAAITDALRTKLQATVDRLGLGLEIVFVGLKDVHPPVPVAPAYQDVISAEEQRSALADHARTYAIQASAAAQVSATQVRLQAQTAARERLARASGESARFLAPLAVYRDHAEVFTTRRHLETLETALAEVRQLILVPPTARTRSNLYLGLDPATLAPR